MWSESIISGESAHITIYSNTDDPIKSEWVTCGDYVHMSRTYLSAYLCTVNLWGFLQQIYNFYICLCSLLFHVPRSKDRQRSLEEFIF